MLVRFGVCVDAEHVRAVADGFVAAGVTAKPMLNIELFGGDTAQETALERGVFSAQLKQEYYDELTDAAARPGLGVFFHNNPWTQALPIRYDLGGSGVSGDPGIRWWFEYAATVSG